MPSQIILASGSQIRAQMLRNAGLTIEVQSPRVDEATVRDAMLADAAPPRDIADTLAEMKARKISERNPDALVIGCDQVLAHDGSVLGKPETPDQALAHLHALRGGKHQLLSAAVIAQAGRPLWRHVGVVRLHMRACSDAYLQDYVARNWDSIRHSVGAYKLEEEGARLFTRIEGDYFTVLGLPLLEVLSFLTVRGEIDG